MPPSRLLQVAVEAERALLCPAAKAAPLEPMAITGAEKAEKPLSSDMQQGEAQGSPTQASGPTLSPRMGIHNLDRLKSSTSEVLSPSPESGQHPFQLPPHNQHAVDRVQTFEVRDFGAHPPPYAILLLSSLRPLCHMEKKALAPSSGCRTSSTNFPAWNFISRNGC